MVATTQLRLALEAEDERNWIWIEFGLRLEFSKISRNVLARPVMGTIFLVLATGVCWLVCIDDFGLHAGS